MPATMLHWTILALGLSLFQFVLKYIATWVASLDIPFVHQVGTSFEAIIP